MNLQHLEAIAKFEYRTRSCVLDGKLLWTDGHIAVPFDLPSKNQSFDPLTKLWSQCLDQSIGQELFPSKVFRWADDSGIVRSLGNGVFINEAYLRAFGDGLTIRGDGPKGRIRFYRDGLLEAVAIGMKESSDELVEVSGEVADDLVFRPFACPANDWYLQPAEWLRKKLDEFYEIYEAA